MNVLIHRQKAVDGVMAKFDGKPFEWGRYDCARLAAAAAREFGLKVSLAAFGQYSTELGALRALKRAGFDGLETAIDAKLARITPAYAMPGDIVGLEGEGGTWPALTVYLGNGAVLGFCDGVCQPLRVKTYRTAWSLSCPR